MVSFSDIKEASKKSCAVPFFTWKKNPGSIDTKNSSIDIVCLCLFFSRTNWNKAVQMCSKAREFALALAILECAIKPVVMLPVWKDSLGHTR